MAEMRSGYRGTVCMSVDYDGISPWIAAGSSGLRTISRGEVAEEATPQLLEIFATFAIPSTWFVPGVTALQYPDSVKAVASAGHEIANHSLRHEDVGALSDAESVANLLRANDILEDLTGKRPAGARLPGKDLNDGTCLKILADLGFAYDSSLIGGYHARWAPSPHIINEDGLVIRGQHLDLVELPLMWHLTDFSQFEFHYEAPVYRALLLNARHVEEVWTDEIDDLTSRNPDGFLMFALHPQVIGRGSRLAMLERVIQHAREQECRFVTCETLAEEFRSAQASGS